MKDSEQAQKLVEEIIKDIDETYIKWFNGLSAINLKEQEIAKLTQKLLISRDAARAPLQELLEKKNQQPQP